jgi:hypothetical protein
MTSEPANTSEYTIYKITIGDNSYIGSTRNFDARMSAHIYTAGSGKSRQKLYTIAQILGIENLRFEVLERKTCTRAEILRVEANYIKTYNSNLNMTVPYRTDEEKRIQKRKHHLKAYNAKEICQCGLRTDKNHHSEHRKLKKHIAWAEAAKAKNPEYDIINTFTDLSSVGTINA